jgi:hypothetical protein
MEAAETACLDIEVGRKIFGLEKEGMLTIAEC